VITSTSRVSPGDLFLSKLAALVVDISELDTKGSIPLPRSPAA